MRLEATPHKPKPFNITVKFQDFFFAETFQNFRSIRARFLIIENSLPESENSWNQMTSLGIHAAKFHVLFETGLRKNGTQMKLEIGLCRMSALKTFGDELSKCQIGRYHPFPIPNNKHHRNTTEFT